MDTGGVRLDVSTLLSAYNSYYKLLQTHVCEDFSPRTPGTLVGGAVISRFGDGGRRQVMVNGVFHGKFWHRIKKCKEKKEHLETTLLQKMGISVQRHTGTTEREQSSFYICIIPPVYGTVTTVLFTIALVYFCFFYFCYISVLLLSVSIRLINNTERGIFYHFWRCRVQIKQQGWKLCNPGRYFSCALVWPYELPLHVI